ncbi:carboxymuconolactone decarboxylase family protein [Vibrio sp. SS-MA-C1-2]|uniref:carboxymuconolactone decarboxylase family protein n=1 Tax=Vibrio sp. SS-MA-C1-2 TaxID=2908646 RepID=UPI001F347234|nr:carboxymuconolactone decarboxylase family protein [Vibrio sp. SS-MA-C1-2]UJF18596.1 carboxymuconolactone decarboxylase family protein [Vibrio sp. SS-MA-C1-2]
MRIETNEKLSWTIKPLLWLQKRHYGTVLNPALLWGKKPTLFWLVATFFGFLDRKMSPIDPKLRSLICVRVSQLNDCAFCIDTNGQKMVERYGSEEQAHALAEWHSSALFNQREQATLHYLEAMTITGNKVTDQHISDLKQWYNEDDIVELTALIAFQNLSAKFNTALDVPAHGFCSLPTPNNSPSNHQSSNHSIRNTSSKNSHTNKT